MTRRPHWFTAFLVVFGATPGYAQVSTASCRPDGQEVTACALLAAGLLPLEAMPVATGARELRYWAPSAGEFPERMLSIQQHGDTITGSLLLIWRTDMLEDSVPKATCGASWSNALATLCMARRVPVIDWRGLLSRFDTLLKHSTATGSSAASGRTASLVESRTAAGYRSHDLSRLEEVALHPQLDCVMRLATEPACRA